MKFTQIVTLLNPFAETSNTSLMRAGWTAGVGAEYAISTKWSVKAEYLYADLGTISATATPNPGFAGLFVANSVHVTENIARAGINYHY